MTERRRVKNLIKIWVIIGAVIIIVGYGIFRAKDFARGPTLKIDSPSTGYVSDKSLIEVKGHAKNISFISLNDNKIFINENGEFKEKILLSYGYNLITIRASDRFGRTTEEKLQLIYK